MESAAATGAPASSAFLSRLRARVDADDGGDAAPSPTLPLAPLALVYDFGLARRELSPESELLQSRRRPITDWLLHVPGATAPGAAPVVADAAAGAAPPPGASQPTPCDTAPGLGDATLPDRIVKKLGGVKTSLHALSRAYAYPFNLAVAAGAGGCATTDRTLGGSRPVRVKYVALGGSRPPSASASSSRTVGSVARSVRAAGVRTAVQAQRLVEEQRRKADAVGGGGGGGGGIGSSDTLSRTSRMLERAQCDPWQDEDSDGEAAEAEGTGARRPRGRRGGAVGAAASMRRATAQSAILVGAALAETALAARVATAALRGSRRRPQRDCAGDDDDGNADGGVVGDGAKEGCTGTRATMTTTTTTTRGHAGGAGSDAGDGEPATFYVEAGDALRSERGSEANIAVLLCDAWREVWGHPGPVGLGRDARRPPLAASGVGAAAPDDDDLDAAAVAAARDFATKVDVAALLATRHDVVADPGGDGDAAADWMRSLPSARRGSEDSGVATTAAAAVSPRGVARTQRRHSVSATAAAVRGRTAVAAGDGTPSRLQRRQTVASSAAAARAGLDATARALLLSAGLARAAAGVARLVFHTHVLPQYARVAPVLAAAHAVAEGRLYPGGSGGSGGSGVPLASASRDAADGSSGLASRASGQDTAARPASAASGGLPHHVAVTMRHVVCGQLEAGDPVRALADVTPPPAAVRLAAWPPLGDASAVADEAHVPAHAECGDACDVAGDAGPRSGRARAVAGEAAATLHLASAADAAARADEEADAVVLAFAPVDERLTRLHRAGAAVRPVLLLAVRAVAEAVLRRRFPLHFLMQRALALHCARWPSSSPMAAQLRRLVERQRGGGGGTTTRGAAKRADAAAQPEPDHAPSAPPLPGAGRRGADDGDDIAAGVASLVAALRPDASTQAAIDAVAVATLDPSRLGSHLGVLEASTDALRACVLLRPQVRRAVLLARLHARWGAGDEATTAAAAAAADGNGGGCMPAAVPAAQPYHTAVSAIAATTTTLLRAAVPATAQVAALPEFRRMRARSAPAGDAARGEGAGAAAFRRSRGGGDVAANEAAAVVCPADAHPRPSLAALYAAAARKVEHRYERVDAHLNTFFLRQIVADLVAPGGRGRRLDGRLVDNASGTASGDDSEAALRRRTCGYEGVCERGEAHAAAAWGASAGGNHVVGDRVDAAVAPEAAADGPIGGGPPHAAVTGHLPVDDAAKLDRMMLAIALSKRSAHGICSTRCVGGVGAATADA